MHFDPPSHISLFLLDNEVSSNYRCRNRSRPYACSLHLKPRTFAKVKLKLSYSMVFHIINSDYGITRSRVSDEQCTLKKHSDINRICQNNTIRIIEYVMYVLQWTQTLFWCKCFHIAFSENSRNSSSSEFVIRRLALILSPIIYVSFFSSLFIFDNFLFFHPLFM